MTKANQAAFGATIAILCALTFIPGMKAQVGFLTACAGILAALQVVLAVRSSFAEQEEHKSNKP